MSLKTEANMSKPLQWIVGVAVVVIVAAVVISTLWPLFAAGAGWTGAGMMGSGHMMAGGGHMTGGFGMPFLGLGMMLWPLLIVGLVVFGIVWLVQNLKPPVSQSIPPASVGQACAHCGNPLQPNWKACPYCGEKV
jgi:hypothetical protein